MKAPRPVSALFLTLFVAIPAIAQAPNDPSATVSTFFARYAAGDVRGAADLWVAGAPAEEFTRKHRRRLQRRCIRIHALRIDETNADGVVETVETLGLHSGPSAASPEWTETSHSRFVLQRERDSWRIAKWESRESELVEQLTKAADASERARILGSAPELETTTLVRLLAQRSIDLVNQQRIDAAGDLSAAALRIAERIGDAASIAVSLSARAVFSRSQRVRDFDTALQLAQEAVATAEVSGDPEILGRALNRFARTVESRQGTSDAQSLARVLAIAEDLESPGTAALAASDLGRFHEGRDQKREAFRLAELASRYAEESDSVSAKINAAAFMAGAYHWTGNLELASRYHRREVELSIEAGFEASAAHGIVGLAEVAAHFGRRDEALAVIEEGLRRVRSDAAAASLLRARVFHQRTADAAERDLELSLEKRPPDASEIPGIEFLRAHIAWGRGDSESALSHIERARGAMRVGDDLTARFLKARIFHCLGRTDDARRLFEEVVAEEDRTPLDPPEKTLFGVGRGSVHVAWLRKILVEQGELLGALNIAEQMKAKELREVLAAGGITSSISMDVQERQRERELEERMRELNRMLVTERTSTESLRQQISEARVDLEDLRQRAYALTPSTRVQRPLELRLDDLPSHLDDVTIVSYVDGSPYAEQVDRDLPLTVFVIEPKRDGHRKLTARSFAIGGRELARKIDRLSALLAQRNLRVEDAAEEIYELLLGPIEPAILSAKSLCIIPDASLWRVPFHALGRRGQPLLVDRMPVFYAPSIAILAAAASKENAPPVERAPTLLAFANPNVDAETVSLYRAFDRDAPIAAIPETEDEVRAIASLYGANQGRVFMGADARETVFKDQAPRYDILHIATHGIVYDGAPMFSSLLLAASAEDAGDDGVLEAREIAKLDLNADVAILSACETGKADSGVIGLSWAFLAAGCQTTVSSQWNAQSAATAQLMVEFHRQLTRGTSKPEALRRAQLALRRDPRYRHPFYWAPFVVIGAP